MSNYTHDEDVDDDADDCEVDHGDAADGEDGDTDEEFIAFSEDELGDVLTDALELYAQENGMPDPRICTFRDVGYLTMNRGVVVRMGGIAFELTIVRRS